MPAIGRLRSSRESAARAEGVTIDVARLKRLRLLTRAAPKRFTGTNYETQKGSSRLFRRSGHVDYHSLAQGELPVRSGRGVRRRRTRRGRGERGGRGGAADG